MDETRAPMTPSPFGLRQGPGGGTLGDPFRLLNRPLTRAAPVPALPTDVVWAEPQALSTPAPIEGVAAMTPAEVQLAEQILAAPKITAPTGAGAGKAIVSNLRAWHHSLARDIIAGLSDSELCKLYGVAQNTLTRLRRAPAFQVLLQGFAAAPEEDAFAMGARLRALASQAVDKLEELLSSTPANELPANFAKDTLFPLLDRIGYAPVQKSVSLTAGVGPELLAALKEHVRGAPIIDARSGPVVPSDPFAAEPQSSASAGSALGEAQPSTPALPCTAAA